MIEKFKEIKERVSMLDVAGSYGYTPNKSGFIRCPFHNEKTASCKIYKDKFYCFGCNAKGDIFEFIKLCDNCSALEALKRVNIEFNCGIDLDIKLTQKEQKMIEKQQKRRTIDKAFYGWELSRYKATARYLKYLRKTIAENVPNSHSETPPKIFTDCLSKLSRVQYLCDVLTFGSLEEKHALYLENKKEVNEIYEQFGKQD